MKLDSLLCDFRQASRVFLLSPHTPVETTSRPGRRRTANHCFARAGPTRRVPPLRRVNLCLPFLVPCCFIRMKPAELLLPAALLCVIALAAPTSSTSTPPFHCVTNSDCQLNGACKASTGRCTCDAGWVGEQCHSLDLLPTPLDSGLQDPVLSSWGGSVLQNATDGSWHMYAEERER